MKKFSIVIALLAVVFGLSQCKKPSVEYIGNGNSGNANGQYITFTANNGGAKLDVNEVATGLELKWQAGDVLHVFASTSSDFSYPQEKGTVTLKPECAGQTTGKFEGYVDYIGLGDYVRFYYFGSNVTENGSEYSVDLSGQDGTLAWIEGHMIARSSTCPYNKDNIYGGNLTVPFSIVKFDLDFFTDCTSIGIDLWSPNNSNITYNKIKVTNGLETLVQDNGTDEADIIITKGPQVLKEMYVALLPNVTLKPGVLEDETNAFEFSTLVLRFEGSAAKHVSKYMQVKENHFYTSGETMSKNDKGIEIIDYVELGGVKWGRYNIAAKHYSRNEDSWYGDYFTWGDPTIFYKTEYSPRVLDGDNAIYWNEGKEGGFIEKNYKFYDPSVNYKYTKYNQSDNITELVDDDDIAIKILGGYWCTPTASNWVNLKNATYWEWTDNYYGITQLSGYIVYKVKNESDKGKVCIAGGTPLEGYSQTDTHVFMPAAGFYRDAAKGKTLQEFRMNGTYDTKTRDSYCSDKRIVYNLDYDSDAINFDTFYKYGGSSVRPIVKSAK